MNYYEILLDTHTKLARQLPAQGMRRSADSLLLPQRGAVRQPEAAAVSIGVPDQTHLLTQNERAPDAAGQQYRTVYPQTSASFFGVQPSEEQRFTDQGAYPLPINQSGDPLQTMEAAQAMSRIYARDARRYE